MPVKHLITRAEAERRTYKSAKELSEILPNGPDKTKFTVIMNDMKTNIMSRRTTVKRGG